MKILFEAGQILYKRTGVGQYTLHLLEHVMKKDTKNSYVLFGFFFMGKKVNLPLKLPGNAKLRLIRYFPGRVYNYLSHIFYPPPIDLLTATKPDLTVFTNFVRTPLISRGPSITFIYDISFKLYPEFAYRTKNSKLLRQVPRSLRVSDHIVTISQKIKQELVEHYDVDEDKISVVYPAVDHTVFKPSNHKDKVRIRKKYDLKDKYILFTGMLEPRKNVSGVISAYRDLDKKIRDEYQLVLVGDMGWKSEKMEQLLDDLKDLDIVMTGYVPDEDRPLLYSAASLFVYPSFYEGFGMPVLEAMACGLPVITSNTSSLPEVVGAAGLLVDPKKHRHIAKKIEHVLAHPEEAEQLRTLGLSRAKKFSWQQSADKLLEIMESLK